MCILSASCKKLSWRRCLPRSLGFACYLFYHVSLTFSRKTLCGTNLLKSCDRFPTDVFCVVIDWVQVAAEENLHDSLRPTHCQLVILAVLYQALYNV